MNKQFVVESASTDNFRSETTMNSSLGRTFVKLRGGPVEAPIWSEWKPNPYDALMDVCTAKQKAKIMKHMIMHPNVQGGNEKQQDYIIGVVTDIVKEMKLLMEIAYCNLDGTFPLREETIQLTKYVGEPGAAMYRAARSMLSE